MEEPMMTEAQRDELKSLCQKANVPDKSGELLTQEGAQTGCWRRTDARRLAPRIPRPTGTGRLAAIWGSSFLIGGTSFGILAVTVR